MIRIVQLGSPRKRGEGLRIGTVRRVPRGVPVEERGQYFDVWLPLLAPSEELRAGARSPAEFERRYVAEMKRPEPRRVLDLLAALSHQANFSVGCYCDDESRCHRRHLRRIFTELGAKVV